MRFWTEVWQDPLYRLIALTAIAQVLVLGGVIATIVLVRVRRLQRNERLEEVRRALSPLLFQYLGGELAVAEMTRRASEFRRAEIAEIVGEYVPSLGGTTLDAVAEWYRHAGYIDAAREGARSWFWWRRLEAARLLATVAGRAGGKTLVGLLDDPVHPVRIAAARGLGRSGDEVWLPHLLKAMIDGPMSRLQIAEVLVTMAESGGAALRRMVAELPDKGQAARVKATSLEVLAIAGDVGAAKQIVDGLHSAHVQIRISAYRAAGLLHVNVERADLILGLSDPRWEVRAIAAKTAGKGGDAGVADALVPLLRDPEWWVRFNAAQALGNLGDEGTRRLMHAARHDHDRFARDMALRVLSDDPDFGDIEQFRAIMESTVVVPQAAGGH